MRSVLILLTLLLFATPAFPQAPPGWIADPKSGCRIWNGAPEPGETISWSGGCEKNIAEGRGRLQWFVNGKPTTRYEGEVRNGLYNGRGVYTFSDGDRYDGEWQNGQQQGRGAFIWTSGNRYDGDFVKGKRTGRGVLSFHGGGRYEGQWLNDQAHGEGMLIYASGTILKGTWTNGCFRQGGRNYKIGSGVKDCG